MANVTLLIFMLVAVIPCSSYHCDSNLSHCHTSLNINYRFSKTYDWSPKDPSNETEESQEPFRLILQLVANKTMPGPAIIVHKNQKITILVNNNLINDAITIHWHGIDQLGWPFMDGVGFVTQCPIGPGEFFNYTFQPRFGGTYWYHSHVGNQRDMGLYGAFIVLNDKEEPVGNILQLREWNPFFGSLALLEADLSNSMSKPKTVLVNVTSGDNTTENITIEKGTHQHRFRLIAVGSTHPLLFSISGLTMNVIETDGFPVEPIEVDKIILYPAERYDFVLDLENTSAGNYTINVNLLEGVNLTISDEVVGHKTVRVKGADTENIPDEGADDLTQGTVLNCPFDIYPNQPSLKCITVDKLKSTGNLSDAEFNAFPEFTVDTKRKTKPFFLNFGFPNDGPPSVNGRQFIWPTVSSISQPSEIDNLCSNAGCGPETLCKCTNSLTLNKGEVTMVLLNLGSGMYISHPVHMHGHTFKVLKMGLPKVYPNGTIQPNNDIKCSTSLPNHNSTCNDAFWSNPTWDDEIPDLNTADPVRKDTIVVPNGGYVVIRINATNPGIWIMHCHIDEHMIWGMALMLNESFEDFGVLPNYSVPKDFPYCRSFKNQPHLTETNVPGLAESLESDTGLSSFTIAAVVLAVSNGVFLIALVVVVLKCIQLKRGQITPPTVQNDNL